MLQVQSSQKELVLLDISVLQLKKLVYKLQLLLQACALQVLIVLMVQQPQLNAHLALTQPQLVKLTQLVLNVRMVSSAQLMGFPL